MIWRVCAVLALVAGLANAEEWSYWIDPCTAEAERVAGCRQGDPDLGKWALEAWARESGGGLRFKPSTTEAHARLRIHWGSGQGGLYGEAVPITVDGTRGAELFIQSETAARTEPLLRDAIVYLTCLHESGHALGFPHTAQFDDIMYNFRYGGDLVEYFARYRRLLKNRSDMAMYSGISDSERGLLRARYPAK